uniref:Uncharacterized protein n=1 Tax=Kalanchoe fedtschenkoi TaxID=63787 RepID=A0A7N0TAZ9_KALFE
MLVREFIFDLQFKNHVGLHISFMMTFFICAHSYMLLLLSYLLHILCINVLAFSFIIWLTEETSKYLIQSLRFLSSNKN